MRKHRYELVEEPKKQVILEIKLKQYYTYQIMLMKNNYIMLLKQILLL